MGGNDLTFRRAAERGLVDTSAAAVGVIAWLLEGDPAIRWQVQRDLIGRSERTWRAERRRVGRDGWGRRLLDLQRPDGHWGRGPYQPKWTCTSYTMLLLRYLGLAPGHPAAVKAARAMLEVGSRPDGGINFARTGDRSETCITGMTLCALGYFRVEDERLDGLADYLLAEQLPDGGWNCRRRRGATHSSFHTTINVLEGLREYSRAGGARSAQAEQAEAGGREFLLEHRLFRSHRTGAVVDERMTRLTFPPQWRHDVLRGLEHFAAAGAERDGRLADAVEAVRSRRRPDGTWALPRPHPGAYHFTMETPGQASRWITLRALRVLNWWEAVGPAAGATTKG